MAGLFPRAESARSMAIVALVVAAVGLGTAIYALTAGVVTAAAGHGGTGPAGPAGPPGATGPQGPPGSNGKNGANGTAGSWAQLTLQFVTLAPKNSVTLQAQSCGSVGEGRYLCNLTFAAGGGNDTEFNGLNYTPTSAFYFAGSNPTFDWLLDEGHSYSFQLWFQAVQASGTVNAIVTLHIGDERPS